jgi:hypothetical protein
MLPSGRGGDAPSLSEHLPAPDEGAVDRLWDGLLGERWPVAAELSVPPDEES